VSRLEGGATSPIAVTTIEFMTTISRSEVQRAFRTAEVSVADLQQNLRDNGVGGSEAQDAVARADVDGDGVISSQVEVDRLFDAADRFDTNGNRNSVTAERANGSVTTAGALLAQAVSTATPKRGLQAPSPRTGAAEVTNAAPTTPGRATTLDDSFRVSRSVDVDTLKALLPRQAQPLAQAFVEAGAKYNVDPLLLTAISKHETGSWTSSAFRNKNNAMGVSNSRGPVHMASREASIDKMAALIGSTTSGPYKAADTYRDLWSIYAPGPATGQGEISNDPTGLNQHWGPSIVSNINRYADALR
jgi:hypothetical protein